MDIAIERVGEATPEVRALIAESDAVSAAHYGPHQRHGVAIKGLFAPHMRFFLGRSDGVVVGCGGVALFRDYAEVKRMYTRPPARRRGVAKALLRRLEEEARAAGVAILRLETGIYQQEAIGLYRVAGFRPCAPFGAYADMPADRVEKSLFFEKSLVS